MKTGLYSVIYSLLSNVSVALCFLPLILLLFKKLQHEKAYLFTAIYWLANGLMNLPGWIGQSGNKPLIHQVTLLYNLLDAPLVLLVFLFAAPRTKRKAILLTLCLFIVFEMITIALMGYNLKSSTVIIGVGTFLALTYSIISVLEYLQKVEHSAYENTMVLVYASFVFAYGIFIVIYLFSYIEVVKSTVSDSFLIYYISLLLSTFLTSLGLWRYAGKKEQRYTGSINYFNR